MEAGQLVCEALVKHGFLLSKTKFHLVLVLVQNLLFIGALLMTDLVYVFLPQARQKKCILHLRSVVHCQESPVRQWLIVQGDMVAALMFVTWAHLHLCPLVNHLLSHWDPKSRDYNRMVPISQSVVKRLQW